MNLAISIGAPELVIIIGFAAWVLLAIPVIWAIVDTGAHSQDAWSAVGQSRVTWIAIIIVTWLICGPLGWFSAIYYLARVRPKLRAAGDI